MTLEDRPFNAHEAGIVDGFLFNPLVKTGQEAGLVGNDSPLTFFDETVQYIDMEVAKADSQLLHEEDPEERARIESSRGELLELRQEVDRLYLTLVNVSRGKGNTKPVVAQILIHGAWILSEVRNAVSKNSRNVIEARQTDAAQHLEMLEEKRQYALRQREQLASLRESAFGVEEGIADFIFAAGIIAAGTMIPELLREQLVNATLQQLSNLSSLSAEERLLIAEHRADIHINQIAQAMTDIQAGEKSWAEIYNDMVQESALETINKAPAVLGVQNIDKVLPLTKLHAKYGSAMAANLSGAELQGLIRNLEAESTPMLNQLRQGMYDTEQNIETRLEGISVARNDILRALSGEPLHTDALSKLLTKEEARRLAADIYTIRQNHPLTLTPERLDAIAGLYQQMLDGLQLIQSAEIGKNMSFSHVQLLRARTAPH